MNANYILDFAEQLVSEGPVVAAFNRVGKPVDFRLRADVGWQRGPWSFVSFVNYTDRYEDIRFDPTSPVESWTTIDANLSYNFGTNTTVAVLNGMRVGVSARNIFDTDPPRVENDPDGIGFNGQFFDSRNANPFGRIVTFQAIKSF